MAPADSTPSLSLLVRRMVRGTPEDVFRAWTEPGQIRQWWGPAGVTCQDCTVELRVGGAYRIANRMPDNTILWISGEFLRIEPPDLIEYTWRRGDPAAGTADSGERVTVRFIARGDGTEVLVAHSRIATQADYASHDLGWRACLEGLTAFLEKPRLREIIGR